MMLIVALRAATILVTQAVETTLVPRLAKGGTGLSINELALALAPVTLVFLGFSATLTSQTASAFSLQTWGLVGANVFVLTLCQVMAASTMTAILLEGKNLRWNCFILARRAGDPVILAFALPLGDPDSVVQAYLIGSICAAMAINAPLMRLPIWPPLPLGPLVWSLSAGLAVFALMRGPVFISAQFLGPSEVIAVGLLMTLAGYVRQTASAALAGLDARFASALDPIRLTRTIARLLGLSGLATVILGAAGLPYILVMIDPNGLANPQITAMAPVVLWGAVLRCQSDGMGKLLSANGEFARLGQTHLQSGLIFLLGIGVTASLLPPDWTMAGLLSSFAAALVWQAVWILPRAVSIYSGTDWRWLSAVMGTAPAITLGCQLGGVSPALAGLAGAVVWGVIAAPSWQAGSTCVLSTPAAAPDRRTVIAGRYPSKG